MSATTSYCLRHDRANGSEGCPLCALEEEANRIPAFAFRSIREVREHHASLGPPTFLIRELWPADAYGVQAAEHKTGKSWNAFDLGVAVSSGTPWLGSFPIDRPGPVLMFLGEGGER